MDGIKSIVAAALNRWNEMMCSGEIGRFLAEGKEFMPIFVKVLARLSAHGRMLRRIETNLWCIFLKPVKVFFIVSGNRVCVNFSNMEMMGDEQAGKAEWQECECEVDGDGCITHVML